MRDYIEIKKSDTRPCMIYNQYNKEWKPAFFHMWMKRERRYVDEPKKVLCAIVETEDGCITQVYADHIRFTDREAKAVAAEAKSENEQNSSLFGEE